MTVYNPTGGSGTSIASTVWSGPGGARGASTGTGQTIGNPAGNFSTWHGTMNSASPAITFDTANWTAPSVAIIRLGQDATGGRVPVLSVTSGAIITEEGPWDFTGAAAAANFVSSAAVEWDGSNLFLYPRTGGISYSIEPTLWRPTANTGAKLETVPRTQVISNTSLLASGRLQLCALAEPLIAGVTYTGIAFISGSTAAVTPTNQWFCLVDKAALTTVRSTTDDTTTAWGATTLKRLALSSPYTPTKTQWVYVGVMVAAATVPTLGGVNPFNAGILGIAPILCGSSTTAMTAPVADGTAVAALTGSGGIPYAYVD